MRVRHGGGTGTALGPSIPHGIGQNKCKWSHCRKGRNGAENVYIEVIYFRRTFDTVGGIPVRRYVKRLVSILRVIEVVRDRQSVRGCEIPINLREECIVKNLMLDREPFFLASRRPDEVDQRETLAIRTAGDQRFVGRDRWRGD